MTKKNDIRYNGSGYYDETAYKAIKNTDRGGITSMNRYNKGEIWEVETVNGSTREVLMIQCFDNYATTIVLTDNPPASGVYLSVKSHNLKYADCGRLSHVFYDKIVDFVRQLSDEELEDAQLKIVEALDLPHPEPVITEKPTVEPEWSYGGECTTQAEIAALQESMSEAQKLLMDSAVTLEGMTHERDVYKDMYSQLLDKLLQR